MKPQAVRKSAPGRKQAGKQTRASPINIIEYDDGCVLERPDGFYYQDKRTKEESGPFASLHEAAAYMDNAASADPDPDPVDDLKEIEEELGIADWIDPDTGEPAEESVPHIEDH